MTRAERDLMFSMGYYGPPAEPIWLAFWMWSIPTTPQVLTNVARLKALRTWARA